MDPRSWERFAAVAGIVSCVAIAAGFVIAGNISPWDSAGTVAHAFSIHRWAYIVASYCQLVYVALVLVFITGLRDYLRRRGGDPATLPGLAYGVAVCGVAVYTVYVVVFAAVAELVAPRQSAQLTWSLYEVSQVAITFSGFLFGMFQVAASLALLRVGAKRTAWVGIVGGAINIISGFSGYPLKGPIGLTVLIGFVIYLLWVMLTSVLILRREG
jgi:hypothetical protein